MTADSFAVPPELAGQTVAAVLRRLAPELSWNQVRDLVAARRVQIDGILCLDPTRRIKAGEVVTNLAKPVPKPRAATPDGLVIRHLDEHVVVVEKPGGINTVRHPAEREWADSKRELDPTLEDLTQWAIARRLDRSPKSLPRLRVVQRLDKETSGLVVFGRTHVAERGLGMQFHAHTVRRRYLAVIPGYLAPQRIASDLIPDRGDGRRGSGRGAGAKHAVTHLDVAERLNGYTMLWCRLETGRTHQIRIHLSESGHAICGEMVYNRPVGGQPWTDSSGAPRLALHATELGFQHPATAEELAWEMPLPPELARFVEDLR